MGMNFNRKLPIPKEIKELYPAASRHARRALPPYRLFTPRTPPVQPVMTAVRVLASASVP